MVCHHVKMPDGGHAIVCSGKERSKRKCEQAGCNNVATKQCDFPHRVPVIRGGEQKLETRTCDRWLCEACAVHVKGKDIDYCPDHPAVRDRLARRPAA